MASAGDAPKAPDPQTVIGAQEQANRYNTVNPFGSSTWSSGGEGGHDTMTQSASPQMQAMMNQAFSSASAPRQQMTDPFGGGMGQLASAIMSRVGARYGIGQGNANNPTLPGFQNAPHGGGNTPFNTTYNSGKSGAAPQSPNPGLAGPPGMMGAPGMANSGGNQLGGMAQLQMQGGGPGTMGQQSLGQGGMPNLQYNPVGGQTQPMRPMGF